MSSLMLRVFGHELNHLSQFLSVSREQSIHSSSSLSIPSLIVSVISRITAHHRSASACLFCSRSDFDFDFASPRLCHFSKPLLPRFLSLYMHLPQFDFALLASFASTSVAQFEDSFTVHAQASDGAPEGPSIVGDLLDCLIQFAAWEFNGYGFGFTRCPSLWYPIHSIDSYF